MVLNLFKSFFVFIYQKHSWPLDKVSHKITGPQCVKLQARRVMCEFVEQFTPKI